MKHHARVISIIMMVVLLMTTFTGTFMADDAGQAVFSSPILVVNTSFLNIRTGPSAQFAVLTTAVGGTELPVLGTAGDGVWYQVSTAAGVGWVNIEFTLPRGDFTNVPLIRVAAVPSAPVTTQIIPIFVTPMPSSSVVVQPQGNVTTTTTTSSSFSGIIYRATPRNPSVNLYRQADVDSGAITVLFEDATKDYSIVDSTTVRGIQFYAIDLPGIGIGWVEALKMRVRFARTTRDNVVVVKGTVAMTIGPGGGNDGVLPILSGGQEGLVTNISADSKFVEILTTDGFKGWVPFESVEPRTGTPTDLNPIEVGTSVIQQVPSTTVIQQSGFILEQGGGPSDIVVQPQSAIPVPIIASSRVVVNTSFLNVRSGPGGQYTVIFTTRGGTELQVVGISSDGVWFLVQGVFGQGWVNTEFVIFRGNIESVPIIRNAAGVLDTPVAVIGSSVQLYAAPGTNFGALGAVAGPVQAPIVARTSDFEWVQINTSAGFGWVLASQVTIRGDANLIPIVSG